MPYGPDDTLRLAEILAPLSLVMDLGRGQRAEDSMAACLLATGLARRMELAEGDVGTVYYSTLLRHLGCTATAHEEAAVFGDELAMRPTANRTDFTRPTEVLAMMRIARAAAGTRTTARMLMRFSGSRGRSIPRAICEVAGLMADRLDLGPGVREGVYQSFERWDGKGDPHRLKERPSARPLATPPWRPKPWPLTTWGAPTSRWRRSGRGREGGSTRPSPGRSCGTAET